MTKKLPGYTDTQLDMDFRATCAMYARTYRNGWHKPKPPKAPRWPPAWREKRGQGHG